MSQIVEFENKTENPNFQDVYDIMPEDLVSKISEVKLIDVRTEDEFYGELGHIQNSELLVLDKIANEFENLPKEQTIVLICRSGNRSAQASHFLKTKGYENTYNLKGGMLLWNEQGREIVK